jgi:hypothetical protein
MNMRTYEQTMAQTYRAICQGEAPWVALGSFMNAWFDYACDRRASLVADPLTLPDAPDADSQRWAAFCAASVEWLCERYSIACPFWVENPAFVLPEPWFDSPAAHKPQVRERLRRRTPLPFARRNVYCGDRVFANKYEFAEDYRHHAVARPTLTPAHS